MMSKIHQSEVPLSLLQSAAKTLVSVGILAILANVAPGVAIARSAGSLDTTFGIPLRPPR